MIIVDLRIFQVQKYICINKIDCILPLVLSLITNQYKGKFCCSMNELI